MPKDRTRHDEFSRHVRRMERREALRTAWPFALAGLFVLGLAGFMGWTTFSTVPCGAVDGVVQAARVESTPAGARHFLTVLGDDARNYYSEDPQDRADPAGARVTLSRSCTHTGQPRPMAHFTRWIEDGAG